MVVREPCTGVGRGTGEGGPSDRQDRRRLKGGWATPPPRDRVVATGGRYPTSDCHTPADELARPGNVPLAASSAIAAKDARPERSAAAPVPAAALRDQRRADPVLGAAPAVPDPGRDPVLLGLRRPPGRRARAAEQLPGRREDLVVARRARPVRRQVLPARLALDDRPRDRPRPARPGGLRGGAAARLERGDPLLELLAVGAGAGQERGAGGLGVGDRGPPRLQRRADPGERVAARLDRARDVLLARLVAGQAPH